MEYSDLDKKVLWLYLGIGSGYQRFGRLMEYYGGVNDIWDNFDEKDANLSFLPPKIKSTLDKTRNMGYVNTCIERWKNPKFVTVLSEEYPELLKETASPPVILFYEGSIYSVDKCIGIVGSRNCTKYGLDCAYNIAKDLASDGVTVVSGGARGIDTKAHEGALDAGGRTVCVLGCGLNVVYPPENERLYYNIVEKGGAVITEFAPNEQPKPWNFPQRNRIISGMSSGVVVIEAGKKSGALITAQQAVDENREVFCVPGNITSLSSKGTNGLIKKGAALIDGAKDVLFGCGWEVKPANNEKTIDKLENLNDTERTVVKAIIKNGSIPVDVLCEELDMSISQLNSVVTLMEINGVVSRLPGNILTI